MTDRHFPLFIATEDKKVLIFGGGNIALRRIKTLLNYGFELYAVSRSFCEEISVLEKENRIKTHRLELNLNPADDAIISLNRHIENLSKIFSYEIDSETYLVLSCMDDRELNRQVGEYFKAKNILVNVCDSREECDFFFPAIAVSDSISVGVTGNGNNHSEVRQAAARIREIVEKKDY